MQLNRSDYLRIGTYLAVASALAVASLALRPSQWSGDAHVHTLMEWTATLIAFNAGMVGIIRFFTRKETLHLFVGVGFLGAAVFDAQHLIATYSFAIGSAPDLLGQYWSWNASRVFVSLILVLSWWAMRRERRLGHIGREPDNRTYVQMSVAALAAFLALSFLPLRRQYISGELFGRPDELLAGGLFALALVGYLETANWRSNDFEHWLILSLLLSVFGQVLFMARSTALFDSQFNAAHVLKIGSYVCVMIGLYVDFYALCSEAERRKQELSAAVESLQREVAERDFAQRQAAQAHEALKERADELDASRVAALNLLQDLEASRTQAVLAEQATRDQAARTQAILDGASDAIITISAEGVIESFNNAAEQMFQYTSDAVIGKNVKLLMPQPYRDEHDGYLQNYLATGISKIIGVGREVSGRRSDGSTFPMHLGVSEVKLDDRRLFTGIVRDITDIRTVMRQLTAANEELARRAEQIEQFNVNLSRSNEELKQFAYVASHDLQEPLRKVTAFCQMLRDDYGDRLDDNAHMYIQYAVDGALRMKTLVQDLLTYSRVETQGKPLEPTSAGEACQEAIENLAVAIEEASAKVVYGPLPVVLADRAQLVRLFQNLIGNAIKYRGDRIPQVEISALESEHDAEFRIRDNGIGIDPQYHDRIFIIFQRLHARDEYSGTGIGLAVCKRIVERAGGRIWVESQSGAGSTFCFSLHKCPAPTTVTPAPTTNDRKNQRIQAAAT